MAGTPGSEGNGDFDTTNTPVCIKQNVICVFITLKTVFDIGMYDAADTEYFLECGYKVIAVEANPFLADIASRRLASHIEIGRLNIINAAVMDREGEVELNVCADDLGSSSILPRKVADRGSVGKYTVKAIRPERLFEDFGMPFYLKIDIEGADRLVVQSLGPTSRPRHLSFEAGEDLAEVLRQASQVGFTKFKLINQLNFLELANQRNFRDRATRKIMRVLGYSEPQYVRRSGRWFKCGHSSGPGPWCSDGQWSSFDQTLDSWKRAKASDQLWGWYDVHAI